MAACGRERRFFVRALLSLMQEEAKRLSSEALQLNNLLSGLDRIIENLSCENQLEAVKSDLRRQKEQMAWEARVLERMAVVLTQAGERYLRSENYIIDNYDEADNLLFAAKHKEYTVPEIYIKVLEGL